MDLRLRNPLVLKLVLKADRLTRKPAFEPLHRAVRRFYRGPLTAVLETSLRTFSGSRNIRLVPRHSAVSDDGFSVFRSDVDYSIVVPDGTSKEVLGKIAEGYEFARNKIPFLGELELYTETEFALGRRLQAEYRDVLEFIRLLRKWSNLHEASWPTDYHREKAELAMREVEAKLGARSGESGISAMRRVLEDFVSRLNVTSEFETPAVPESFSWRSEFVGWTFRAGEISPRVLEMILSLIPELDNAEGELGERLKKLREIPALKRSYAAVAAADLLTSRSVRRIAKMNDREAANADDWIARLEKQLAIYDAELFREIKTEQFQNSSDFCVLPWVELQLSPEGVKTCCAQSGFYTHDPRPGLGQVFNNSKAAAVRKQFLAGTVPAGCAQCVNVSRRTETYKKVKNPIWIKHEKELRERTAADGTVESPIRFLDLRFSNLCNFACRTCDSFSSSRWAELDRKLGRNAAELKSWDKDPAAMRAVLEVLPTVEEIYFAGGEPLLIDGHYEILEWLIANKRTGVKLTYNTNLSVRNFKGRDLLELWKRFETVDIMPSIDSIGAPGEYIRHGFRWSDIEKNIDYFRNYIRSVHSVVSVYNVYSILDQILWVKKNLGVDNNVANLYSPACMAMTILPAAVKQKVTGDYERFLEKNDKLLDSAAKATINGIVSYMNSADHSRFAPEFKKMNETIDAHWSKSFQRVFPELAEWYAGL